MAMAASMQGAVLLKGRFDSALERASSIGLKSIPSRTKLLPCFRRWNLVCTKAALAERASPTKSGSWTWKYGKASPKIHFVEHGSSSGNKAPRDLLLLPTVSDVSTTEEWEAVAKNVVSRDGPFSWRAVTVDWPGFGLSDRPSLDYTVEVMERFLVDFVTASDGPLGSTSSGAPPVIVGGGHAATIAIRALTKASISARGVVAVAPTWAGPLPIVFGRSPEAESRYGLLRSALRAPGVGWAMYNVLVSSPSNIRKQYESHVYADSSNVTDSIVESRLALTKREGARYAPAAFLTGMLDPVRSREEFLDLFSEVGGKVPAMVMFSKNSPRRSRGEMEALRGAKGVVKFVEIPGALLPQEEYPEAVANELYAFLESL